MPRQADQCSVSRHRQTNAPCQPAPFAGGRIAHPESSRYRRLVSVVALAFMASGGVGAETKMPEGMLGWWYYISVTAPIRSGHARTPEEACALNASNHFNTDTGVLFMEPWDTPKPWFKCFYRHPVGGRVSDFGHTRLECLPGYSAKAPGVCVKAAEAPRPPSCNPSDPGFSLANPVAVASGAKIQTETDFAGAPNGALRIIRTYRTLRDGGAGQSAGQTWSFSFDRSFAAVTSAISRAGDPPVSVNGAFGDGSSFDFYRSNVGTYVSRHDKRQTLEPLSTTFENGG